MINMNLDFYYPEFSKLPDDPELFEYYELRIWINHHIVEQKQFKTLKEAKDFYKKRNLSLLEDLGSCYIEIIRIKPLKKQEN